MPLPCTHPQDAVSQVQPAIDLLRTLDARHPEVLVAEGLKPPDYHGKLVFRSAVESIRGSYIASSTTGRHDMVGQTLERMKRARTIEDFQYEGRTRRHDFTVEMEPQRARMAAVEVKGGEGNSINISQRPMWATEFIVWCHLDGAIKNQPASGAASIVFGRLASEMVRGRKQVDALIIKDSFCGTPARPCPKVGGRDDLGFETPPCIFLFPRRVPTEEDSQPPVHDSSTLKLPFRMLDAFGVSPAEYENHIYRVAIRVFADENGRPKRETSVTRLGELLGQRTASGALR